MTAKQKIISAAMAILTAALLSGCASRSDSQQQAAFLAGQNALLRQQQEQATTVTVIGPVQNSHVPWVVGLTLAQAIATANYLDTHTPKTISITHDGETATLEASPFSRIAQVPLDAGDIVEIQPQQ